MEIVNLIFLENIVDKLARKHNVKKTEVKEVFNHSPKIRFIEKGSRIDENVYAAYGTTYSGRYLIVFFIYKKTKEALIISGRDMTYGERRKYQRK